MDKHIEISVLLGIYGELLTSKQYKILNDYYNNDLSLSEISELQNITRQAVRDLLMKGEKKLFDYEKKLKIMKKNEDNEKIIQLILTQLNELIVDSSDKKVEKVLSRVQKELNFIV